MRLAVLPSSLGPVGQAHHIPPHSHPLSRPSDSLTRALLQTISWAASLPLSPGCPQGSSSDLDLQVL